MECSSTLSSTGFVQRWLSWRCFVPLARLSYAVFLIHFAFVKAYTSQQRKPFYFTEFNFVANYVGTVAFTFILATILCTAIELPFHNLDKLIFPNKSKPTPPAVETARGNRNFSLVSTVNTVINFIYQQK